MIKFKDNWTTRRYEITNVKFDDQPFFYEISENEEKFEIFMTSKLYADKMFCIGAMKNQDKEFSDEDIIMNYMIENYKEDIVCYLQDRQVKDAYLNIDTFRELEERLEVDE